MAREWGIGGILKGILDQVYERNYLDATSGPAALTQSAQPARSRYRLAWALYWSPSGVQTPGNGRLASIWSPNRAALTLFFSVTMVCK
jgi:hypothetical protein